jgi:rubrerythrin
MHDTKTDYDWVCRACACGLDLELDITPRVCPVCEGLEFERPMDRTVREILDELQAQ